LKTKAVDRICALLASRNEAIALRAAEAILDRTMRPLEVLSSVRHNDAADFDGFIETIMKHGKSRAPHVE
jgi:hypothetical protein